MENLVAELMSKAMTVYNLGLAALGLGLVIFLHELGHFAVAKWCNVFVERFSIGFGPVLFSRKWGETEYALSLIPFGGYVKMLGQDDADPSQLTNEEIAQDPRSYVAKNVYQRMAIISAGVTMNILTALLFFAIAFRTGFPTSPSLIGDVRPGMPAWEAGLSAGDQIDKINGSPIRTYQELQLNVALSSGSLRLEGTHADGKPFDITVEPDAKGSHPQIGVLPMESLTIYENAPGHAAARANPAFRAGDQIKQVGEKEVKSAVDFHREVAAHQGATLQITVDRKNDEAGKPLENPTVETITITDNFFRTLGLTLDSGPIAAVRHGSPAEKAGLKKGDKLAVLDGLNIGTQIDPLKLPVEFAKRAGKEIEVTVTRQNVGSGQESKTVKLIPEDIPGWLDQPEREGEPLAIPAIGAAFHILPVVLAVEPGSSADKAGLKPGPLKTMTLTKRQPGDQDGAKDSTITVNFEKGNGTDCAYAFWLVQRLPQRKITLTTLDEKKPLEIEVVPEVDKEWTLPIIGLTLEPERLIQKADSLEEAVSMSFARTKSSALDIYLTLRSLIMGRVSYKELHGPLGIAGAAYQVAQQGWIAMLLFLGFLSVNLAVLNFLPIPVLDGGHMVFLIWEAVTNRRPSERVMIAATYVGFAFLLGLMALVIYLDVFVHPFAKK